MNRRVYLGELELAIVWLRTVRLKLAVEDNLTTLLEIVEFKKLAHAVFILRDGLISDRIDQPVVLIAIIFEFLTI